MQSRSPGSGRVSYQGEPGSNSYVASQAMYPQLEPLSCTTFEDTFAAVDEGNADVAVIPVENSLAGRVADIHHLVPTSDLFIVAEHFMPIHFSLLTVPGTSLDQIRRVRSHVHAFGQCRGMMRRHGWSATITDDTAGAAREVAELGDPSIAALSPRAAAELYGLEVLKEDVEDADHNTTRFLAMAPEPAPVATGNGPTITTFVFRVRNVPAALYKALGGFATNGINMTKLESYQLGGTFYATQFYSDVEGHPDDRPLALALEELAFFSAHVRVLGTYPAHPYRHNIAEPLINREVVPVRAGSPLD